MFRYGWMLLASLLSASATGQDSQLFGGIPQGKGQIETFAFCSACHSMMIVKQQRLSRDDWEETLEWMVEEQGMDELPEEVLPLVLDYLEKHFGEKTP